MRFDQGVGGSIGEVLGVIIGAVDEGLVSTVMKCAVPLSLCVCWGK